MSRRGCVEKIEILADGTIPTVEMTSLGFEDALSPYKVTPADIACVLKGEAFITEHNPFERVITNIKEGTVIGYKYYEFGDDYSSGTVWEPIVRFIFLSTEKTARKSVRLR